MQPIVSVRNLTKRYPLRSDVASLLGRRQDFVTAVDGVSFELAEGEALGLVGGSGSGKTTVGRLLLRLDDPDGGDILLSGRAVGPLRDEVRRNFYRTVQMIFQDPFESLNPRFTVLETLADPLRVQGRMVESERLDRVSVALAKAGLSPPGAFLLKYPHELSGGQRQRVAIARALVLKPRVLVADEPVSMLDVSIKAGILNVLRSLARNDHVAILYISHDLSTVRYMCQRTVVMYRGRFVEVGPSERVFVEPQHPYSQALKAALPVLDPRQKGSRSMRMGTGVLSSEGGCRYRLECPLAMDVCAAVDPELKATERDRFVACHLY